MSSSEETIQKIAAFYAAQAPEFDDLCGFGTEPFEQRWAPLKSMFAEAFKGLKVLEIACGTGYWTRVLADTAASVLATDVNPELVARAQQRVSGLPNVRCQVADAYTLDGVAETFSGAFANLWWSHVPKNMLRPFLNTLHSRLQPGALVLFADSLDSPRYRYLARRRVDEHGDIYEERVLNDGRRFETIKNFPSEAEIRATLEGIADDIVYKEFLTVWVSFYRVRLSQ